ncbi:hypothetical protein [Paenibacillus sp. P22]|uniref:hypothetical protein n=1 Tax=Paenibacillus sp. P22 TaxID=483908 RepID=UPI00038FCB7E|nr:hypothetical protein [Paenibacillus sp. P22]CDN41442.1 hypothetical protein BN871_AH_00160 [Paenibacillus sp. P22]
MDYGKIALALAAPQASARKARELGSVYVGWFIKGDGTSDDANNLRAAFAFALSIGARKLTFPDLPMRLASTVEFNFGGLSGFTIDASNCRIMLDVGITQGIRLVNGRNIKAEFQFEGGGQFTKTNPDNFYNFAGENGVTGVDAAVHIRGISSMELDVRANNFAGRVIEIKTANAGEPKTELMNFGKLFLNNVGQSFFVKAGSGLGNLGEMFVIERNGFYIRADDVSLPYYENYMYADLNGCRIDTSTSVHLGTILIGDRGVDMIRIHNCKRVTWDEIFVRGRALKDIPNQKGVVVTNSRYVSGRITSMDLLSSVLYIVDSKDVVITGSDENSSAAFKVENTSADNDDISIDFHCETGAGTINSVGTFKNNNLKVGGKLLRLLIQGKNNSVFMNRLKTIQDTNMTSASDSQNNVTAFVCNTTFSDGQPNKVI